MINKMSESQDEIKAVTTGKDPKRVQWGKELGKKNKGRKKIVEPSDTYTNKMMTGCIVIGVLGIIVISYYYNNRPEPKQEPDPPKKQIQDLSI